MGCRAVFHARPEIDLDRYELDFDVREFVKSSAHAYKGADTFMFLSVDKEVPEHIRANPETLQRILTVMLANAIKYTPSKEGFLFRVAFDESTQVFEFTVTTQKIRPDFADYESIHELARSIGGSFTMNVDHFSEADLYIPLQ